MKVAILGTRGIPNNYGGFEQFAEYLSQHLVAEDIETYVYNSSTHPYQETTWKGVHIIHCFDPEDKIGTAGQFIYDLNCIRDARKRDFDIILQLGYTSSSVWSSFLPKRSVIVTNMDGLEWKRSKYSKKVQAFLKWAERRAVKTSDHLVSDSLGIQQYLQETYHKESTYIAYGANPVEDLSPALIEEYQLQSQGYHLVVARLEPENNVEEVIAGYLGSKQVKPLCIVGKHQTPYGNYLKTKYSGKDGVRFLGGVYDKKKLDALRQHSEVYFHGHSVGGTNPSLLEAMAAGCFIVAHNNHFNKAILQQSAHYFESAEEVTALFSTDFLSNRDEFIDSNKKRVASEFSWERINSLYSTLFAKVCADNKNAGR